MQAANYDELPAAERMQLAWLAVEVSARRVSQVDIAYASGVHQSQVSRILAGAAKRSSANVRLVCKYANELRAARPSNAQQLEADLNRALMQLWDGTAAHANALIDLLNAVERLQPASGT